MKFGISENSMAFILEALAQWKEIEGAAMFGSRAMGNYKNGSDIDLVVYGNDVTEEIISKLSVRLNQELPVPYYFDIVYYESLTNLSLKAHIDKYAKPVYKRNSEIFK